MLALPRDPLSLPDAKEQLEFLLEQLVVVGQVVAEQRERFGERPATGHDLGPPTEMRSSVAKSWNTRTGSSELSTVTALVRRMRLVRVAAAARTTAGVDTTNSER